MKTNSRLKRASMLVLAWAAPAFMQAAPVAADSAQMSAALTPGGGRIVVEATGVQPVAPLFFTASAEQVVKLGLAEVTGEVKLSVRVVQGKPEVLTLGLAGDGEVASVAGVGLRDWSVRQGTGAAAGKRFLDLRPLEVEGKDAGRTLELTVTTRLRDAVVPGNVAVLLVTRGEAVGFDSRVRVQPEPTVDVRLAAAEGVIAVGAAKGPGEALNFVIQGDARIEVAVVRRGAALAEAELTGVQLTGVVNEAVGGVDFKLQALARVEKEGARLRVLAGRAALTGVTAGDGWHIELVKAGGGYAYDLVFDKKGAVGVAFGFVAAVREQDDWRTLHFRMPAGTVVPVMLTGFEGKVDFDPAAAVVPEKRAQDWQGFLPVSGNAAMGWKKTSDAGQGALFFTSSEQSDVQVGAGLLRQSSQFAFRILQGKLNTVRMRIDGPGEIVGVEGPNVLSWRLVTTEKVNFLEVGLSRPFEGEGALTVRSQAALGAFPVRVEPMRLTPEGGVRHAGFVRVVNTGAVRLEVAGIEGMMQLAPEQFPGGAAEDGARQVFVYRFPSAEHAYEVLASQILPEVGVSQVVTYTLAETDRVIEADLELDVREAPLRDWSLSIPADYAVVAVTGAEVADYAVESAARDGRRALKIFFGRAVDGRQLLRLRLEKNQAAGAGEWALAPLVFPGAKSVRGHVGVVSAPGYRLTPTATTNVVEVPLSYFPKQVAGLQQAWRLSDAEWGAGVKVEALGQSVQADVFHLYSLKEGVVYGSVLINYFVVGAPASEWRIEVPATVGNIDVIGQGVRRDWRREGNQVIVTLHQPVLGASTLLVTFEEPMSARGGVINPGEVRPLGVQAERGYLQVVSPLQVKHEILKAEGGLLKLEPLELPAEFRLLTSSPSLAVYQYTARPFTLNLSVNWYQPGETVDQVIDFAKLSSQVSRDGQVVTDARFFVKTRGRKALRLELPAGVKLWESRVDGEVVNARADGGQTLVPLPARLNPNEPAEVALRLGQEAGGSVSVVTLTAPKLFAPMIIGEWTLRGDSERLLVPKGGNADLTKPTLTERGFEWIENRAMAGVAGLLLLTALAAPVLRSRSGRWLPFGLLAGALAALFALVLAGNALANRRVNLSELSYASTVVPAGGTVSITVANVMAWQTMVSWPGVAAGVVGLALCGLAFVRKQSGAAVAGAMLLGLGLLAQRGGAAPFFAGVAAAVFFLLIVPGIGHAWRNRGRKRGPLPEAGPAVSALIVALVLGAACGGVGEARADTKAPTPDPWTQDGGKTAQAMEQRWEIKDGRLFAELSVTVRGVPGESFLLLKAPAVMTAFAGDGLRAGKIERNGSAAYFVTPERAGVVTAQVKFEMPVPDLAKGFLLPTGAAAVQRIAVQLDQRGWEFTSPMAVEVLRRGYTAGSAATLIMGTSGEPVIRCVPQSRNLDAESKQLYAETANLYVPGPGVVNGYARVTVRPVNGRVTALDLDVPEGFTVGDVGGGPVGAWRFDPEKRRLHVAVEPAQTAAFAFVVETQRGAAALPFDLTLRPLRVSGAAGEVGMIALGFGGDAQPEGVKADGLSSVNSEDFDATLLPRGRDGQPLAALQQVYRYGREGGAVSLRVASVSPEVRVASKQVVSLGDDRLVLAVDLDVAITRVGLFKLSFNLPDGLEVEALSGAALSHWAESKEDGRRVITMHLNGRTIGDQSFVLTLVGPAPAAQAGWTVPKVLVREATRQTGELQLVPEKGLRLRAMERTNISQLDPRTAGNARPGALAFRLLQADWVLTVGIEALEPWVTVQALQEVTVREGQTLTRIGLRYRVENAAIKLVRVRLPGLSEDQVRTVRATGTAVGDFVAVAGEADLWEIRFQRGIVGETDVQIEFQGQAGRETGHETVATPVFVGARQVAQFVAVRGGGRLELEAADLPHGWQRTDWSAVPAVLLDRGDRSVPALSFRVAEPEKPLVVTTRRHEVADALKLRVTGGELTTLFSPAGTFLTAAELNVEVVEKSTLRVRLPKGAQLFNTLVNGESVSVVREDDAYLFHVSPNTAADHTAKVRIVYAVTDASGGRIDLLGPGLNVPLENVSWRVVMPPGYQLAGYAGGLRLREDQIVSSFGLDDYRSSVVTRRAAEVKQANDFIVEANSLLQQGQQQAAGEVLSRASKTKALDEATNEDARVQLRALKTQQAVVGLNTRRQKLYMDNNGSMSVHNAQLEQAASLNPFLQGKLNYNPQQVDQLLMGNTVEENTALSGIAGRIVDQQLAAEPAPSAIDVTLPERGQVLTFTRSLQVDGGAPLELSLDLKRSWGGGFGFGAGLLLAVGAIVGIALRRRPASV